MSPFIYKRNFDSHQLNAMLKRTTWTQFPSVANICERTVARGFIFFAFLFLFVCLFVCLFVSCDDDFSTNFVVVFCPMEELELVKTRLCALNHRTVFLPEERKQVWANLALKCG